MLERSGRSSRRGPPNERRARAKAEQQIVAGRTVHPNQVSQCERKASKGLGTLSERDAKRRRDHRSGDLQVGG